MAVRRKTTSKAKVAKATRPQEVKVGSPFLSRFKTKKFLILLFLILAGGILFYFKGLFIVATVNGQPVSRIALIQELEKRNGKQMLSSLITQILIQQEAQKQNISVSQKEINDEVKRVEDGLKKQGQTLDAALSLQGLTKDDFIAQIKLQKLVEKMLAKDIKVTDKEVSDYIEKNKDSIPKDLKAEEVTASARQQLQQQKLSSKAQSWIQGLQSKAKINYFINY
jgi:foldase protein PrsA